MDNNMNYNPYDNQNQNFKQNPQGNVPQGNVPYGRMTYKPANSFENASMILGFSSLVMCNCLYFSIPAGALAIIFAFLSRGKRMELGSKATVGLVLGIIGIVITVLFYIFAFYVAIEEYGSFEALLRESCEMSGYDFDELFGDMFQ